MKSPHSRVGSAVRVVLLVAFIALGIPALLVSVAFLGYRSKSAAAEDMRRLALRTQEALRDEQAARVAGQLAPPAQSTPAVQSFAYPVTETEYLPETIQVDQPVWNQKTGQMEVRKTTETRMVPRNHIAFNNALVPSGHDPMVMRLVVELRGLNEDDENHDRKLSELRQRLELEFAAMHDQQSKEIEQTAARLESLKKMHEQRGANRDKIVQRRIDELLGRSDALQWEIRPNPVPPRGFYSAPNAGVPTMTPNLLLPPAAGVTPYVAYPTTPPTVSQQLTQPSPFPTPNDTSGPLPSAAAPSNITRLAPSAPQQTVPAQVSPSLPPQATQAPTTNPLLPNLPQVEIVERRILADNQAEPSSTPANSMISRIFELARKSGAAASALQSLESEHKRISEEMLEQDSSNVSRSDLDRAEAELAQVRREVELNRLELGALGDSLRRSQQFAQSQLESTQAVFEVAKTKHDQGIAPSEELIRVKRELSRAQERLEEAKANLMQLDRALSLVQGDQNLGNDSQSDSDREQEIREEVPEPNSNTDQPE